MARGGRGGAAALVALALMVAVLVASASAGIITFKGKQLKTDTTIRYRMAMMADKNNPPFIKFDHKWTVEPSNSCAGKQTLHILLYPAQQAGSIGKITQSDESRQYCCSDASPECRNGIWISSTKHVKHYTSETELTSHNGYVNYTIQVATTSQYIAEYVQCSTDCVFAIDGSLTFKNPYGYLSAELRHYIITFGILMGLYFVLLMYWLGISCWHRRVLLMVQYWIALVIFLGLVESISWFLEFLIANVDGKRNWPAIETAILVSTCKRTLSRVLVLIVSMGYGVVKYHLGNTRVKVYLMGAGYFVASGIQSSVEIMSREGETNEFLSFIGTVVIFPVILLDTFFYWWIFLSIMKTIQQLTARQASVKLTLYKQFFTVLVCAAVFTACVMIVELSQVMLLSRASLWMSEWMITACWHGLYFVVLTMIAILWRPTENNTRYAYTESEDAEIMLEEVHPVEGITQRKTKEEPLEEPVGNSINTDSVDVELTLPSFTIDEDDDFLDEAAKMQ